MTAETGETTAAINARMNARMMPDILSALRQGGTLFRPAKLDNWYIDMSDAGHALHHRGGLTRAAVKTLERDGVIRFVGVDRYGAAKLPAEDAARG